MANAVVRLASLTLNNIKNVKNGTIVMPMANKKTAKPGNSEILGIYGQNGSGKTAVIDTLYYLQKIMIGEKIDPNIADYVDVDETDAEINAEFNIFEDSVIYEVGYHIV
ncbi:MAG: ATP-binding protein, partial [Clostridia bacterium]|nr:ATP-binding protein [Schwartzia sp. (in: firmicutes)]MBR5721901.1 ATP-binding protein [Clostridia bacterium]